MFSHIFPQKNVSFFHLVYFTNLVTNLRIFINSFKKIKGKADFSGVYLTLQCACKVFENVKKRFTAFVKKHNFLKCAIFC